MNAYITTSCLNKIEMWNKVKNLSADGLNMSQISRELGIHRDTVRKYLKMSESEFLGSAAKVRGMENPIQRY